MAQHKLLPPEDCLAEEDLAWLCEACCEKNVKPDLHQKTHTQHFLELLLFDQVSKAGAANLGSSVIDSKTRMFSEENAQGEVSQMQSNCLLQCECDEG